MKAKYKLKIKRIFLMIFVLISISCAFYSVNWDYDIKSRINIRDELNLQNAGDFTDALLEDVKCFPVRNDVHKKAFWGYEDSYGDGRTFGGNRKHEGIDIMSSNNVSEYFAVQSVSDGIVEKKGWLKLGGYRIGIRSKNGIYYYYAHLASYAKDIQIGDKVSAGQILGYMGDTGYGPEGTRGKFAVHLHFGIYIDKQDVETSINPYSILRWIENLHLKK